MYKKTVLNCGMKKKKKKKKRSQYYKRFIFKDCEVSKYAQLVHFMESNRHLCF